MPYPVTIAPTPQGYDLSESGSPAGRYGFEYNGNQYAFLCEDGFSTPSGDHKIHAMKSTDLGLTWNEQDSVHAPAPSTIAGFGVCYTVAVDGTTVIVLAIQSHLAVNPVIDGMQMWKYSLASDTWVLGPTSFASPVVDFMGRDSGSQNYQVLLHLVVRGATDYVLLYSGPQEVSGSTGHNLARMYCATFDGTTFGAAVKLPGQTGSNLYFLGSKAGVDASLRTWMFGMDNAVNAFLGPNFLYWVMDHSGTINNGTVAPGLYWANVSGMIAKPQIYVVGGVEIISIASEFNDNVGNTSQSLRVYSAPTSMTPVWSSSIVTQGVDTSNGASPAWSTTTLFPVPQFYSLESQPVDLTYSNGNLQVTWATTAKVGGLLFGHFYGSTSSASALSWSAPVKLFDSVDLLPGAEDDEAYQVYTYPMSAGVGVIGVTSESTSQGLAAQFFLATVTPPPPGSFGNVFY